MTRAIQIMLIAAMALAWTASPGQAGSIWARSGGQALHADDVARRVGDVLTIVIAEHSVIENENGRSMGKSSARSASVAGNVDLLRSIDSLTGKLFSIPDMELDISAESDFEGDTSYDIDRKMVDQITVTVNDVLPNGNLVVVGSRHRKVAGDTQIIQVSGVVRTSDVTFSNTVSSDRVAEFRIVFREEGRETQFTRPGWLDWILNTSNPF